MAWWYTNVPFLMLYHGQVVECCTKARWYTDVTGRMLYMAVWYTDVPGRMLYHGRVVH